MEYRDLVFTFEKALSFLYIRAKYDAIQSKYPSKGDLIKAMNGLMELGKESETYKYWDSVQSITDKMATGRA